MKTDGQKGNGENIWAKVQWRMQLVKRAMVKTDGQNGNGENRCAKGQW